MAFVLLTIPLSCKRLVRRCTRDHQVHGHGGPTRGSHGRLSSGPPPPGQETRHPPHQPAPATGIYLVLMGRYRAFQTKNSVEDVSMFFAIWSMFFAIQIFFLVYMPCQ